MSVFRRSLLMYQTLNRIPKPIASYRCYEKTNDDEDRDILKDLTGNGHNIQLYNFGFAEGSGYGKYTNDFSKFSAHPDNVGQVLYAKNKIQVTGNIKNSFLTFNYSSNMELNSMKIKVSNLPNNTSLWYNYIDSSYNIQRISIRTDGIYNLPNSYLYKDNVVTIGFTTSAYGENYTGLTIEQIPDYQGALVSDGVDDYGLCENFPILTKEKGYTVCAIRKWISMNDKTECFLSKRTAGSYVDGSFIVELKDTTNRWTVSSFGANSTISDVINLNSLFISQTSNNYNLSKPLPIGDNIDNNKLIVFSTIGGHFDYSNVALYALEIYDRDLTDEEIVKVKARMIAEYEEKTGEKYPIEYPGLIAAWSAEGKTNSDPDRNILRI